MNDAEFLKWLVKDLPQGVLRPGEADRLTAIAERLEWRPIDSAPKDDSTILLLVAGQVVPGHWTYDGYCTGWILHGRSMVTVYKPTHWQPLPLPPTDVRKDGA